MSLSSTAAAVGCSEQRSDDRFSDTRTAGGTGDGGASAGPSDGDGDADAGSEGGSDGGDTGDEGPPRFDVGVDDDDGGAGGDDGGIDTGPVETCEDAEMARTSIGCEFFGARFDNWADESQLAQPFALAFANVDDADAAELTLEVRAGAGWTVLEGPVTVGPLDVHVFTHVPAELEGDVGVSPGAALRVTSTRPVVGYQFNPLDGGSQSSDASLLYPVTSWDHLNLGATWQSSVNASTNLQIIAAHDGTQVELWPTVEVEGGGGVPGAAPGGSLTLSLNAGDVANVGPKYIPQSLAGSWIASAADKPVAVFASNGATTVGGGCCADHMEEQTPGLRSWGKDVVAPHLPVRNTANPEPTVWEIYASEDGTSVTFEATTGVTGLPGGAVNMDRGDVQRLAVTAPAGTEADFVVHADKPILAKAYMLSTTATGLTNDIGDPAMVAIPPAEQFLTRQVVLVPDNWVNDYVVLLRPDGAAIELDGVLVPDTEFNPVGTGDWEVARVPVDDGVHVIDGGADPAGVVVVGYDAWDSYAYTGGTGAAVINTNPTPPAG